ncbi:hypothetical protein BU24DRAFT_120620 [Aaosphaeria arxii CBS 175.79]|uniref:Zn(2)-C6 fungal-type domain-containing protein n=1 Tax=Aaosphaeria arxii CBS 175.79 TaxID=1450172 RepID=A0A6A5Y3R8_9PLEO|nr:uncharacterized protein BU24DRAFT_120620 [Aaosphaeria arxii CBS 175.79]KAF2019460.1 hypothetical protein BU24DRAFT_120620 [Aaosphaeria arxii CBS 175.79]
MSRRFKGRSAIACLACHSQKLKCSGGDPCQRCRTRGRECVFPIRDRILSVSESYIRDLEAQVHQSQQARMQQQDPACSNHMGNTNEIERSQSMKDCTAECFVQSVKELSSLTAAAGSSPTESMSNGPGRYTYAKLKFDYIQPEISIRLPPKPYALHLLEIFEEGFCDYHWFLRRKFRERLMLSYSDPQTQTTDRNWLCRVSVVLALAETWNRGRSATLGNTIPSQENADPIARPSPSSDTIDVWGETLPVPPGSELFEQCLLLLKISLEEPSLEDVEALNLIAFYSYTLNRRKTAFFYARQSLSLAKLLSLDQPSTHTFDSEQRILEEHRKRIWWTCYCMDRMVSTELGIAPMQDSITKGLQYPDSSHLSPPERADFFEPFLLTAQVQLSIIKGKVVETVTQQLQLKSDTDPVAVLKPCMDLVQSWREGLPPDQCFSFDAGIPSAMFALPFHRVLASLYLRYHQCIILLFRPILLRDLAATVGESGPSGLSQFNDTFESMKLECIEAARSNCKILMDLCKMGKIAKFGYWESLHLFSGLAILALSRCLNLPVSPALRATGSAFNDREVETEDAQLYTGARCLLVEMSRIGNLAAQDFTTMLIDIETMARTILDNRRKGQSSIVQSASNGGDQSIPEDTAFAPKSSDLLDSILEEQMWYNIDWEDILRYGDGT